MLEGGIFPSDNTNLMKILHISEKFLTFPSLGVIPYNNRTLSELRVSDCAIKFEMVNI